ncbi:MAG: hypothetical protein RJA81_1793, partial [Planctomycetota bacterium]
MSESATNAQPHRRWHDITAISLLFLCLIIYFWPLIIAKSALFYFDVTELNYAYRHYFAENLKKGVIAFWCDQLYNGFPIYSESQTGFWHPLKFLFYPFFSTWCAFGFDMVASLGLTGVGTYLWLRRHANAPGALAGAMVVTFGGFTWAHFVHTSMINALASVPWIIWGLEKSWQNGPLTGSVLSGFALACQVFAGHLQDAVFSIQLVILISFYQVIANLDKRYRIWILKCGLTVILSGVLISAVQWLPSYELLKRTPRTEGLSWQDQTFGSWHPQLLPTLIVREAYGTRAHDTDWMDGFYPYHEMNAYLGLTAMTLALLGLRHWRDPWVGMWVFIGFMAAIFMLGRFTFVMDFWHKVPILGSSRIPVRYHLWATLAAAALASMGLSNLSNPSDKFKIKVVAIPIVILLTTATILFIWTMIPWWTESGRWSSSYHRDRNQWLTRELIVSMLRSSVIFGTGLLIIRMLIRIQGQQLRTLCQFLLSVLIGLDLISSHWQDMPTVDPTFWTSPPQSVAEIRRDPKAQRIMGIARYSAGEPGYASTKIDFFRPRDALGWSLPLAYGLESNIGETPFRPARLIRLTDLAGGEAWRFSIEGVTHLVSGQPINTTLSATPAGSAYVYRLPEPEPRFHWAKSAKIVSNEKMAEDAIRSLGTDNISGTLVVENQDGKLTQSQTPQEFGDFTAGIRPVAYGNGRMEIHLNSSEPRLLRIGVSYDPGWRAQLDGNPVTVYPAQLAF